MAGTSRGGMEMDVMIGKGRSRPRPNQDTPFRILVLGSFSGRDAGSQGRPVRVEVTAIDELMERYLPKTTLELADGAVELEVEELDDFHPDALYDGLPVFKALRQLRRELQDPGTFERAAASLREAAPAPAGGSAPQGSAESEGDMMERLLGKASAPARPPAAPSPAAPSPVDGFVRQIVAPHVVRGPDPDQAGHLAALDKAAGELMRAILHHPRFQQLEATWRGLDFLLRSVEGDIDVWVLDRSKSDVCEELRCTDPLATPLAKHVVGEAGAPEPPWALVVGAYTFADTQDDAACMGALARVLAAADTPLLSAAD
ncbi:MAG: type VI secretion system contractile sheath domain-containing protein, partial [Myxococcota bacterium]